MIVVIGHKGHDFIKPFLADPKEMGKRVILARCVRWRRP